MSPCGHSADGQLGLAFEDFPDAFHLLVEVAVLPGGEFVEWLHCDVEFSARAAQVPDPGDRPVDEQHREVSGLATGSQRTFGSPAGEEQLARLAADRVGIEVGQQPYAMGCHWRHRGVPGRQPCKGSVDLNLLKLSGEGIEELYRPPPGCTQPLRELLRGWLVRTHADSALRWRRGRSVHRQAGIRAATGADWCM